MSNLNGLRQLISLAMRDGHKTVTIPLDNASMIVVEYEKHRVAAKDAIDRLAETQAAAQRILGESDDKLD